MHSGMVRKCSDNDRGMLVDTESVALSTDILPASSAQIGRHAPTCRRAAQRMNEPVLREPDRLSARCPEAQVSGEWDAPGQRTRNGVPTRPRIPRNGVVAEIIMVGPLSVSSWRSRPGRMFDRSRRVNTIGTAIRSATPFPENIRNCIPEQADHGARFVFSCRRAGPVPSSRRAPEPGLPAAPCVVRGPVAARALGAGSQACTVRATSHRVTEHARRAAAARSATPRGSARAEGPVPNRYRAFVCACDRTRPPRAPRRSPSGHRPRRRSARCHPR